MFEHLDERRLLSAVVTNSLDSGAGSLRQAILDTNATLGLDDITFNIPGAGPHTIAPLSALPTITDPVVINGASEPDFAGSPVIELDGGGVVSTGLRIEAGGSTVRGLAIGNFTQSGVELASHGGNQIVGNYIGVQPDGVTAAGNSRGVYVTGTASNTTIGGTAAGARNIVSGNFFGVVIDSQGANHVVQGNYIGVGADGASVVSNTIGIGVFTGVANTMIGGIVPGARNVIAGNTYAGIDLASADTVDIQGNYIGVLPDGVTAAGNLVYGVVVEGSTSDTTIGGTTAAARNVISGNGTGVVTSTPGANNVILGNYIGLGTDGLTLVPNTHGLYVADGSDALTIGGLVPGAKNVIAGNADNGIYLEASHAVQIQGNYIGVLPDGITAAGNGTGVHVFIDSSNTTIGGTVPEARNIVGGNVSFGIVIDSPELNNVVEGNYVGVGADGTSVVANAVGIFLNEDAANTTVGGVLPGARNVIAGNTSSGIWLFLSDNVQIQGNYIGVLPDGVTAAGNDTGVLINGAASNTTIGGSNPAAGNVIAFNGGAGVAVVGGASLNNTIRGNSIFANGALGIDLSSDGVTPDDAADADSGPNGLQNFPVLLTAGRGTTTHVIGTLASTANTTFDIDFFANSAADPSGQGEGERFLGSMTVVTNGAGIASVDINTLAASLASEFITSTATGPEGTSEFSLALPPPVIVARHLFYNQSGTSGPTVRYDGNDPQINALDDNAIASDKVAYLPGQGQATFTNMSSYTKGINGIMIDLAGPHGSITAADFIFKVGNNNSPNSWTTAPAPTSVSVRAGAGTSGSDRVEIIWANGAIKKQWLEVVTLAGANTGLSQKPGYPEGYGDAFFFGNAIGDTGAGDTVNFATVGSTDEIGARNHPNALFNNIPLTNVYDFNRDAIVDATDQIIVRNNFTGVLTATRFLNLDVASLDPQDAGGEVAATPLGDEGEIFLLADTINDAEVASGLTVPLGGSSSMIARADRVTAPASESVSSGRLDGGAVARAVQQLAAEDDWLDGEEEDVLKSLLADLGLARRGSEQVC